MLVVLETHKPEAFQEAYIRAFRKVLRIDREGIFYGWERLWVEREGWEVASPHYHFYLEWRLKFGAFHAYWDGPHCGYCFGPFTFFIDGNWKCKECCPE